MSQYSSTNIISPKLCCFGVDFGLGKSSLQLISGPTRVHYASNTIQGPNCFLTTSSWETSHPWELD